MDSRTEAFQRRGRGSFAEGVVGGLSGKVKIGAQPPE